MPINILVPIKRKTSEQIDQNKNSIYLYYYHKYENLSSMPDNKKLAKIINILRKSGIQEVENFVYLLDYIKEANLENTAAIAEAERVLREEFSSNLMDVVVKKKNKGDKGERGKRGEMGPKPVLGVDYPVPQNGLPGRDGKNGVDGEDGEDGRDGIDGLDGEKGEMGDIPKHEWKNTKLRFEKPNHTWGKWIDLGVAKKGMFDSRSVFGGSSQANIHWKRSGSTVSLQNPGDKVLIESDAASAGTYNFQVKTKAGQELLTLIPDAINPGLTGGKANFRTRGSLEGVSNDNNQRWRIFYADSNGESDPSGDNNDLFIQNTTGRDIHLYGTAGENVVWIQDRIAREGDGNTYIEFNADNFQFVAGGISFIKFTETGGQDIASFNIDADNADFEMKSDDGSSILYLDADANSNRGGLHVLNPVSGKHSGQQFEEDEATTTDATETTLYSLTLSDDSQYDMEFILQGIKSDGSDRAKYKFSTTAYRDGGNATLQDDILNVDDSIESDTTWDATVDVNSNDVRVRVTGKASTTIYWSVIVKYVKLTI